MPTSANNPLLWQEWDACQLLRHHDAQPLPTLVDVGLDDPFLAEQLGIDALAEVAAAKGVAAGATSPCRLSTTATTSWRASSRRTCASRQPPRRPARE